MAPKAAASKPKADKTKQLAKAKTQAKAAAKDSKDTTTSEVAVEAKKEQQNFVNTLKYRATKCNSTEAQQLLKAHWDIFFLPLKMMYANYGTNFIYLFIWIIFLHQLWECQ